MEKEIHVRLNYLFKYNWVTKGNLSFVTNDNGEEIIKLFEYVSEQWIAQHFRQIKSNFALVIETDSFLVAATDRVRSFPLFFKSDSERIIITDSITNEESDYGIDPEAGKQFMSQYCCLGNTTLFRSWKQLQPGEYFFFNKITQQESVNRYSSFRQIHPQKIIDFKEMRNLYLKTFGKILNSIGSKTIILPLSGGYDSRSILSVLHELGAKNIFAYTYGSRDSFERTIAERIAERLKLNWRFVEYSESLLQTFFSEDWMGFALKNHHFSSLPNEQDFFALYYLRKEKLLPEDGIIFSGYLGDCLGGSMFKNDEVGDDKEDFQDFSITNLGCKYILNSVRVFENFNLDWRVPLMSPELLDAWFHITLEERCFENNYNNFLRETFFKPLEIDFLKRDHFYSPHKFKKFLKKNLPSRVVTFLKEKRKKKPLDDPNNTTFLKNKLISLMSSPKNLLHRDFNQVYAIYFLSRLYDFLSQRNDKKLV